MLFPKFAGLPSELQEEIILACATEDLLGFARTSKRYYEQIIPLLYRDVDISVHNRPGLFPGAYCSLVHADNPNLNDESMMIQCEQKQQKFFNALKIHPDYGSHVIRLSWTHFSSYDMDDRQISEVPVWDAFGLLPNVMRLDFASLALQRECVTPPPLFPCVTHLRLLGQMSFPFLRSFTDSLDPTHLISVEFNNLQDFGQLKEGEDLPDFADLAKTLESEDLEGNSIIRHPGCMRGHLQRLHGRCTNLKRLFLRSVGNDWTMDGQWSPTIDAERYKEWASFIDSVRPTLESLVIEQGLEYESANIAHCRPGPLQVGRPMDERFLAHVLPILIRGDWPYLKEVKILGIGSKPRKLVRNFISGDMNVTAYVKDNLSLLESRGVSLEVQEAATKTFFFRINGPYYEV
ncbi:hypothetical protein BDZ45DRAFT_680669 [Acephala macrosclerotiorum]|nr:hypothetical protein BDZ45DRAFT_680669 [Acephala macrosclerotiorum]